MNIKSDNILMSEILIKIYYEFNMKIKYNNKIKINNIIMLIKYEMIN